MMECVRVCCKWDVLGVFRVRGYVEERGMLGCVELCCVGVC